MDTPVTFENNGVRKLVWKLPLIGLMLVVGLRWRQLAFMFDQPPLILVAISLVVIVVSIQRLPLTIITWWLAGLLTVFWSLAPGNTLVSSIWELLLVASLAAGRLRVGFWVLSTALLFVGMVDSISLNMFGLAQYVSGSIHYVAGAQALVLVPLTLGIITTPTQTKWYTRLGASIMLGCSSYMTLASGARAVYLPLALIVVAFIGRSFFGRGKRRWLGLTVVALLAIAVAISDSFVTNRPIASALSMKGSLEAQAAATRDSGVLTQRIRLWSQAVDMAVEHPLGTGNGSYAAVTHAFQKYPMLWSRSPHNYFLETAATGGWLRLILLLVVLILPLRRVWLSRVQWPWALAAAGIWATLAFDVTSYYVGLMSYAFLTLGAATFIPGNEGSPTGKKSISNSWLSAVGRASALVAAVALVAWWFYPCRGVECATERYLGVDFKVLPVLAATDDATRQAVLGDVGRLYPQSLWVLQVGKTFATSDDQQLEYARDIAKRFPYQDPENYLAWARAAQDVGSEEEVWEAITTGLLYFPPDEYPYGESRITPLRYEEWLKSAAEMLRMVVD